MKNGMRWLWTNVVSLKILTEDFCFDICLDKYHAFASPAQILNIDRTSKSENMIQVP